MKKTAFTICAKNYIGLAQTLEASIKKFDPDVQFYIFVADEFTGDEKIEPLPANVIIAKEKLDIPIDQWYQMAFKYDLTEFCTSIKPSCFKYIFQETESDACIYFDPDILTFSNLDVIYDQFSTYSIVLTPHITTIETNYTGSLNERNLLFSGMFNLGFIGLKNDDIGLKLINWWAERLKDRCYQNMMENYFTDQKWMDFIPSFFPTQTLISDNLGLNLAPWNFYEREIIQKDGQLFVKNRIVKSDALYTLTFVHFSGFNYSSLLSGEVIQGNIKSLDIAQDLEIIFSRYTKRLMESEMSSYIKLNYTYKYFSNGVGISMVYRKLFRRLLEDGKIKENPFLSNGTLYHSLKENGVLSEKTVSSDKVSVGNVADVEGKTIKINKFLNLAFKILGPQRFFQLARLMRLYSKIENHIYLIDKSYLKSFKIWN